MRKIFLAALFLCQISLQAQDYWCLDKHISIRADYGYFRRQGIRDLRLVEDTSQVVGEKPKKLLDTDDLVDRFNYQSAIRGGLTYHNEECSSLEALYTFFYPWSTKSRVFADGTLQFPFKDPFISIDFRNADEAVARYRSWLQSGEVDYWGHVTPQRVCYFSFSWTLGLRMFFLEERFKLVFKRGDTESRYKIKTHNNLYGPQLGAMFEINPSCWWTWTFIVKGAGFLNDAENKVLITDLNDTFELRDYTKRKWTDSWLLEGYGQLAFHWCSWLSLEFAYQGFILSGLVLAPAQRDVSASEKRRINTKNQIIIDGLYAGLMISF